MHRRARLSIVLGAAAVAGIATLSLLSGGHISTQPVAADTATATATATPATATPAPATATPTPCTVSSVMATPATAQTGVAVSFSALLSSSCTPAQAATTIYIWNFGDGSNSGTGNPTSHTYMAAGSYQVVVSASNGASGTAATQVLVSVGLTLNAGGPYTGTIGKPVAFSVSASGAPVDTVYSWNFGDSSTGTGASVSHQYSTNGTYNVTVTATSASTGASGTATTTATITAGGTSLTITGPTTVTTGQTVSYSVTPANAEPADFTYSWNFGDGTTATGSAVTHAFATAGTFTVTVTGTSPSTPSANASASTSVVASSTPAATGPQVTYQPGWNLVGGPAGSVFSQASGPLYTYQGGDTAYQVLSATTGVTSGEGYWAFFTAVTTVSLNGSGTTSASINVPAGSFVMIANPSSTQTLTVRGADVVYTFNPTANAYGQGTTLAPGQGAWVYSAAGATVTVSP